MRDSARRCIVTIAYGPRYDPLLCRMRQEARRVIPDVPIVAFRDELPPGAPTGIGLPHLAYCAKPWAMQAAAVAGYETLVWLDAACYPVRDFGPLWELVDRQGYYVQANGWSLGQWSSDDALAALGIDRETAFSIPEISTMALGLDMRRPDCQTFLAEWCRLASDGRTFMGAHTNIGGPAAAQGVAYRETGRVSDDPRVMGTRHDQTAATGLVHRLGWTLTPRPVIADYWREVPDPRTVVVNRG